VLAHQQLPSFPSTLESKLQKIIKVKKLMNIEKKQSQHQSLMQQKAFLTPLKQTG
jgi:hypothetical protein